jgi:twinkle protein
MKTWADFGIQVNAGGHMEQKTVCPQCSPYRKKSRYPCLSINTEKGVWHCFHCAWSGTLKDGEERRANPRATPIIFRKPVYRQTPLPSRVIEWFARRGIPESVLARNRISYGSIYMPQLEQEVPAIQFPYFRNGEVVNVKYRDGHKYFRMEGGAERVLYGLDDIHGDTLLVCEGEIDKLSLEVAGYSSCVSVPDGAPAVATKNYESKFDFLLSAEAVLTPLTKIVLAVDSDSPGQKLAEELARRLGPERCYHVRWASDCKDANDVLISHGVEVLRECIEAAQPWPVHGIITVDMLSSAIDYIYEHGMERGVSPGWGSLAQHYTVRPGEVTIVTGIPSHGKSTLINAMMIELARHYQWRSAVFSPENYPLERFSAMLLEQYTGLPFDGAPGRMDRHALTQAKAWLTDYISFLMPEEEVPTVAHLLDLARIQVYRHGIKGLVLDPWNEIEHSIPAGQTETQYISQSLSAIRRFARLHRVHVWVIAHPTKLHKAEKGEYAGQYPPPSPYDISGGAHWRNKADVCLCVWRHVEADDNRIEVHIQKIRFREIGKPGKVDLIYEPDCGRFHELPMEEARWSA